MRSISASDATHLYTIQAGSRSQLGENLVKEAMDRIRDPYVLMQAINIRLEKLKKLSVSAKELKLAKKEFSALLKRKRKEWVIFLRAEKARENHEKEQSKMHELAWRCIKFVDSNPPGSRIVDKGSHPFSQWLSMSYKDKDLSIEFRYQESPYSNGHRWVKVGFKNKTVFEVDGQNIKTYIPGEWEKNIPALKAD